MRSKQNTQNDPIICLRCGQIGHKTEDCNQDLPTIEQMRIQMDRKTRTAITDCSKNWINDEYGLYMEAPRSIPSDKTFNDGIFCFNCGCFGHSEEDCTEPTFDTLYKLFKPYLNDHSAKSTQKKKDIIKSIHKFVKQNEKKKTKQFNDPKTKISYVHKQTPKETRQNEDNDTEYEYEYSTEFEDPPDEEFSSSSDQYD